MDRRSQDTLALYHEIQHFRQPWMWALVLFIAVLSLYGAFQQMVLRQPFGNNPAPDGVMIVLAILFGIGLPVFMYVTNLTTEVRSDGLYFRFLPFYFAFHRIAREEIKAFEACTYRPLRDYSGWGIRYGRKGKAYNVSGNRGVQLELTNGKRLMIGSQKPDELGEALASILGER